MRMPWCVQVDSGAQLPKQVQHWEVQDGAVLIVSMGVFSTAILGSSGQQSGEQPRSKGSQQQEGSQTRTSQQQQQQGAAAGEPCTPDGGRQLAAVGGSDGDGGGSASATPTQAATTPAADAKVCSACSACGPQLPCSACAVLVLLCRRACTAHITSCAAPPMPQAAKAARVRQALLSASLVIVDEAHVLKNADTRVCRATRHLATRRRLALTGYPLQNNLSEYFQMIAWVRESRGRAEGCVLMPFTVTAARMFPPVRVFAVVQRPACMRACVVLLRRCVRTSCHTRTSGKSSSCPSRRAWSEAHRRRTGTVPPRS
jgi:hypothetical protein